MSIYLHLCCPMDSHASRLIHLVTSTLGTLLTTSRYLIRICWVTMSLQKERKGQEVICRCNLVGVVFSLLIHFFFCTFHAAFKLEINSNMLLVEVHLRRQSTMIFLSPWCWPSPYGCGVRSTKKSLYFFLTFYLSVNVAMSRKGLSCLVSASTKLEKFV